MRSLSPPILILGLSWIGMASGSPQEAQHEISSEPVNQDDSYEAMPGPELSPELWLRTTSAMESRSSSIAKAAAQLKKVTAEIESSGLRRIHANLLHSWRYSCIRSAVCPLGHILVHHHTYGNSFAQTT